jgi:hypothetical protein
MLNQYLLTIHFLTGQKSMKLDQFTQQPQMRQQTQVTLQYPQCPCSTQQGHGEVRTAHGLEVPALHAGNVVCQDLSYIHG